jgi:hypothetical protein
MHDRPPIFPEPAKHGIQFGQRVLTDPCLGHWFFYEYRSRPASDDREALSMSRTHVMVAYYFGGDKLATKWHAQPLFDAIDLQAKIIGEIHHSKLKNKKHCQQQ